MKTEIIGAIGLAGLCMGSLIFGVICFFMMRKLLSIVSIFQRGKKE